MVYNNSYRYKETDHMCDVTAHSTAEAMPIQRVGLYIPGGRAPLFSTVLMLAAPARIAGCKHVVLCTPQGADGRIAPEII